MESDWVTKILDKCIDVGVSFFFKRWGRLNKKVTGRLLDDVT